MKQVKRVLIAIFFCAFTVTGLFFTTKALFEDVKKEPIDSSVTGEIGISQYFDSGLGTVDSPFIITRPYHLYNLSMLTNMGIYSNKMMHFQVGKLMNSTDTEVQVYTSNTSKVTSSVLNMAGTKIQSIGSVGAPFFQSFDGKNIVIDNLTVTSKPEDVGVFGYIASGAKVKNALFSNVTVESNGYTTASPDLNDLFTTAFQSDLQYVTASNSTTIGAGEQTFTDLTGSFLPVFPSELFEYEARTTLPIFTNTGVDIDYLSAITGFSENTEKDTSLSARMYFVAKKKVNNYRYARVISSYRIQMLHAKTANNRTFTMKVQKDDVSLTGYGHRSNVGMIAGHCDGSLLDSYVYNGTMKVNGIETNTVALSQETESGLIGEIGEHIQDNALYYEEGAGVGDTGIVFSDDVYTQVREDVKDEEKKLLCDENGVPILDNNQAQQYYFNTTAKTFADNPFKDYLLRDQDNDFIGRWDGNVEFKGKQVIKGNALNKLGVFDIVTGPSEPETHYSKVLASYVIRRINPNNIAQAYSDFYYTTAEFYNETQSINVHSGNNNKMWTPENPVTTADIPPTWQQATLLNTGGSIDNGRALYYQQPFKSEVDALGKIQKTFYFQNADQPYLVSHLENTLIDINQNPILQKHSDGSINEEFGINAVSIDKNTYEVTNVLKTSKYFNMAKYGSNTAFSSNTFIGSDGYYYCPSSIYFDLKRDCNITIFASSDNSWGNNLILGIYDYASLEPTSTGYGDKSYRNPRWGMYIPSQNSLINYYDAAGNYKVTSSGTKLFAHTFKIPKGKYFMAPSDRNIAVHYIAVQGQERGDIGPDVLPTFSMTDLVKNVDFLVVDPRTLSLQNTSIVDAMRAKMKVAATFNTAYGTVIVLIDENGTNVNYTGNLLYLVIMNPEGKRVYVNGTPFEDKTIKVIV